MHTQKNNTSRCLLNMYIKYTQTKTESMSYKFYVGLIPQFILFMPGKEWESQEHEILNGHLFRALSKENSLYGG